MVHRKGSNITCFEKINFPWRKQYCNKCKLTQISHLKILYILNASAGHMWPLIAHPWPGIKLYISICYIYLYSE